jgi:hypothetical protein
VLFLGEEKRFYTAWVIRDRVEPASKSGHVSCAAESEGKFIALGATP